jgi:hypothetical protein
VRPAAGDLQLDFNRPLADDRLAMTTKSTNARPPQAAGIFNRFLFATALFALLSGGAMAQSERTWTDVDGRTMQATIVSVGEDRVRVLFKGRETSIPLERLSAADREYVEKWEEENGDEAPAGETKPAGGQTTSGATFDGKALTPGGRAQVFEFEYTAEFKEELKKKYKGKAEDTGYRISIAVPEGFDPTKPQKVLIPLAGQNNEGQTKAGNIAAMGAFAGKALAEGWVCIAYDSNLGSATVHTGAYHGAIDKILLQWPQAKTWSFAVAGSSGGGKAALGHAPLLASRDLPVRGIYLAGVNSATNLTERRDAHRVAKGAFRETRCFISTGKKDGLVSKAHVESVVATLRAEGVRDIREEWFEGGHEVFGEHIPEGLRWIAEGLSEKK